MNGVNVHIYEPKNTEVSSDTAYVVAEGKDGALLEMVFGAHDPRDEKIVWEYINRIVMNISEI